MENVRQFRAVIFLVAVFLAAIVAYLIFSAIKHSQEAKLDIYVLPEDAIVKLDGEKIKAGSLYVKPGSYKIEASKGGFKTDDRTIEVRKKDTLEIYLLPRPESADALAFFKQNPDLQVLSEEYAAKNVGQVQSLLQERYPLLDELPYISASFRVDYGISNKYPDDPSRTAIYVRAPSPETRRIALDWIASEGYNPADYEIIFTNFNNPFSHGH